MPEALNYYNYRLDKLMIFFERMFKMNKINVDFSQNRGKIKPLHGMNNAPVSWISDDFLNSFVKDLDTPFFRLHDARVGVDVHIADICGMFPDFSKDPTDPANYEFAPTDLYLKKVNAAGSKIFFRLGQGIEWGPIKRYIAPPSNYKKWATVCEYVIRHYNEGWADGFKYGFEYWEIWNEPEMPSMWLGTKEDYFEFYDVAAKHLKECFPNLKFGGYASCGFAEITRDNITDHEKKLIPYFKDFLKFVKENSTPFDFFSWHVYALDCDEMITHAEYARKVLDKEGFSDVETYLTEWNHNVPAERLGMKGACYVGGALCGLQCGGNLDGATYYLASISGYNALYSVITYIPERPYYAFKAFAELFKLGTFVKPGIDGDKLYACAAKNDHEKAVMIVNSNKEETELEIDLKNLGNKNKMELCLLDDNHNLEVVRNDVFESNNICTTLTLSPQTIILVKIGENNEF